MSGAIRRGPTTADDFTVCHNLMFRSEGLLTPSEVVVLGNVLSHKAGWETTAAGIAKQVGLCTATVKTALSGLSRKHFVIWGQDRNADGTLGTGWYFVTDIPLQLLAAGIVDEQVIEAAVQDALAGWSEENPRSAPGSNISPSGKTDTAGGPVDNSQDDGSTEPQVSAPSAEETAGGDRGLKNRSPVKPVTGEFHVKKTNPQNPKGQNTNLAAASSLREELPPGNNQQLDLPPGDQPELGGDVTTRARDETADQPPQPRNPEDFPEPAPTDRELYGPDLDQECGFCLAPAGRLCVRASRHRPLPPAPGPHDARRTDPKPETPKPPVRQRMLFGQPQKGQP